LYLFPRYELVPEDGLEDALQTEVRLYETACSCQQGQLEGTCDAYLSDEGLEGRSQSERNRSVRIQLA